MTRKERHANNAMRSRRNYANELMNLVVRVDTSDIAFPKKYLCREVFAGQVPVGARFFLIGYKSPVKRITGVCLPNFIAITGRGTPANGTFQIPKDERVKMILYKYVHKEHHATLLSKGTETLPGYSAIT